MKYTTTLAAACLVLQLGACTAPAVQPGPASTELAIRWALDSAEYVALSRQVYRAAADDLPRMLADPSWSALPDQHAAAGLPPAIIMDVDETAVSNARFQMSLVQPFEDSKLNDWSNANHAVPVPGAAEFVQLAGELGVTVFYVTNRPCESADVTSDPCPQKAAVIGDLIEAGFPADDTNVLLSRERPGWTSEKSIRRNEIAKSHRVLMLIGDDLGDFIACTRKRALAPCESGATRSSRHALVDEYNAYWGAGWYVLPNPMHGSWTSVE